MKLSEQLDFLKELQEELNTQDHQCQADPRFWVVRETFDEPCWEEQCDGYNLVDDEGNLLAKLDEDMTDIGKLTCVPVHKVSRNAPNTLFITLRDARRHIESNSYHYRNPHTYAMTAFRSPSVEKLWEILQTIDWNSVQAALEATGVLGDAE